MSGKDKQHHIVIYVDSFPTETAAAPPMLELHDALWPVQDVKPEVKRYRVEFEIPVNLRAVDADVEGVTVEPVRHDWVTPYLSDKAPGDGIR